MAKIDDKSKQALVTYVVNFVADEKPIGKKALQKFVHILGDVANLETGFTFSIYTYGPFSRSLAAEIDTLDSLKAISVLYDDSNGSFEISPGENSQLVIDSGSEIIGQYKESMDHILASLKGKTAWDLELYSTLTFLVKHVENMNADEQVVDKLLSLKPKYSREKVLNTLAEVKCALAH